MEKAVSKVGSFWISKKTKQEFSNISQDISTFSDAVEEKAKWVFNKLKVSKAQKSLGDVLREHNLPPGIFPENVKCYELEESKGKLTVYMASPCEVKFKDSSVIRYGNRVKGTLSRGKLSGIEGMKTKVIVWVKVTNISVEASKSDKLWFTAGVNKSRPKHAFEIPRQAIPAQEF